MEFQVDNLEVHLIMIMIIIILCKVATGSLFLLNPVLAPTGNPSPRELGKSVLVLRFEKNQRYMFLQIRDIILVYFLHFGFD